MTQGHHSQKGFILNCNFNPAPEDYRAAFLINADVIN